MRAFSASGYCVALWLPQMAIWVTAETLTPAFWASWAWARFLIQPGHRIEAVAGDACLLAVAHGNQAISIGRIAHHQDPHIRGGSGQSLTLADEYRGRFPESSRPRSMPGTAWLGANQQPPINPVKSHFCSIGNYDVVEKRKGAVIKFHNHALKGFECRSNLQQVQRNPDFAPEKPRPKLNAAI